MNAAYKHLDTKLKIADLTLGQWMGIMLGFAVAVVWTMYVSPFGTYMTLGIGVYLGAIPAGLALLTTFYEVDLPIVVRSAVSWSRMNGRFVPGPGPDGDGYLVTLAAVDERDGDLAFANLDPAALWES
jgi:hypothetical protein